MNVLNIALRKDAFEKLINGETNEIPIKKNDWWKKRLIDQETGVYKKFNIASVTCGSAEKFTYAIEKIELKGNKFIITVEPFRWIDSNGDIVEPGDSDDGGSELDETIDNPNPGIPEPDKANESTIISGTITREQIQDLKDSGWDVVDSIDSIKQLEPDKVNPVTVNPDGTVTLKTRYTLTDEQKKAIIERYIQKVKIENEEQETQDVKERVLHLLDSFCEQKDVFVVNMPNVIIRYNGQIVGYHGGRKLIADRDSDVRIDFKKHELVMMQYETNDDGFVKYINDYLDSMLKNNYVFINRKSSGFYIDANVILFFVIFNCVILILNI